MSTSEIHRAGNGTEKRTRPRTTSTAVWSANTISVEPSTAAMYVAGGSGVERIRFSTPDSRRITIVIASPANAVAATP